MPDAWLILVRNVESGSEALATFLKSIFAISYDQTHFGELACTSVISKPMAGLDPCPHRSFSEKNAIPFSRYANLSAETIRKCCRNHPPSGRTLSQTSAERQRPGSRCPE